MKRQLALAGIIVLSLEMPVQAQSPIAAAILSSVIPGLGESYNNDFKSGFPWGECIASYAIGFVSSSVVAYSLDAAGASLGINTLPGANIIMPLISSTLISTAWTLSRIPSVVDAAKGETNQKIRFNFWSL